MGCIYAIENLENGKVYIGSAIKNKARWRNHKCALRNGTHHNSHLQRAWDYYGKESFEFLVVENHVPSSDLIEAEQYWLDRARACGPVYNQCMVIGASRLGLPHTKETRRKMSVAQKGKTHSKETRRNASLAKGRPYPSFIHQETGEIIPAGRGISTLCREMGLTQGCLSAVARGDRYSHKGWILVSPIDGAPTTHDRTRDYPSFYHQDTGEILPAGHNLTAMCREYGLERSGMNRVMLGQLRSSQGWELL